MREGPAAEKIEKAARAAFAASRGLDPEKDAEQIDGHWQDEARATRDHWRRVAEQILKSAGVPLE